MGVFQAIKMLFSSVFIPCSGCRATNDSSSPVHA